MSDRKAVVILAAGKGKRMKSDLPKVLHTVGDKPIISILLDTLEPMDFEQTVVVVGYRGELVEKELDGRNISFAWQREQKGTGHAVMMAKAALADFDGTTLVALGDVPFLSRASIDQLFEQHRQSRAAVTCLSAILDDPTGYGRIVRKKDSSILQEIVEDRDASPEVREIREINTGTFCFDNRLMFEALEEIDDDNSQGEFYLTDTINVLHNKNLVASVVAAKDPNEVRGVNSAEQLELLAGIFADRL